jgi:glycosyltransferase involved in cell wall biosynthesis
VNILIITTHPIQYHAPLFSYLTKHSQYSIKVIYTLGAQYESIRDDDFGVKRRWNIDLLSGYDYEFVENSAKLPSSNKYWGIQNPGLIKRIEEIQPDAILIYGWKHHGHLVVMRYFKNRIPVLFRGDSTILDDNEKFFLFKFMRYQLLKWVYMYVDYVLSPGIASDLYFKKSGVQNSQIIRAEHAVDNEHFSSFSIEEEWKLKNLRNQLSISDDEIVFVFAGKFIEKKNPLLLIKAFALLAHENENARLVFVGNGILEHQIKEQISSLHEDISRRIDVLPFQDQNEMKIIYRLSDIFVLPSKSETWGLSVNEALACGATVIVSDKCGCSLNLVKDGFNGYVIQSENTNDLFQKMLLVCNPNHLNELKDNVSLSLNNYTYSSFQMALHKIINEIER